MALTDVKVRNAKPADKPVKLTDGNGMHLLIHPNGSKYWRLQYRFAGKQKLLALGVYPAISLADARNRRDDARRLIAAGIDPSEKKKAEKVEQSGALAFESVARDWHASNIKSGLIINNICIITKVILYIIFFRHFYKSAIR